jgi:DNA-binding LacI/PurR family transcriptional regulator
LRLNGIRAASGNRKAFATDSGQGLDITCKRFQTSGNHSTRRHAMAVTIRDVARAAGVSASTVSRALSNPGMVDAATRERVTAMAEHLGYRPNRAARGLITGRTGNLGLILPDLANPFFPAIVKGIQQQAHRSDYQVFVADTDEDPEAEIGLVRALAKQVDGIILCSPRMSTTDLREAAGLTPLILLNRKAASILAVTIDNAAGTAQIIDHLASLGHTRIGWVAGPRTSWSSKERVRGLRSACRARSVELVELGNFAPTFEGGRDAAEAVVLSGVSAVVAYNDLVALGLLGALHQRGIEVPTRISVVGIDDIPTSTMVHPALTTLAIPKEESGRSAVDLLLSVMKDPERRTPAVRVMPLQLVVRQTTGPLPTHIPATSTPAPSTRTARRPRR